jgi:hypothetical protein
VVDAVTLHVIRRLDLGDAVAAVCGPIGIVAPTALRIQQKMYELKEQLNKTDLSLAWRDGQVYRNEITPAQKRDALTLFESDEHWIAERAVTLPAAGIQDPSPEMRKIMKRAGGSFADELRAAQGSSRLLVCEDHAMRIIAETEFGVASTWLQPVLMKALADGKITLDEYSKAILAFIDTRFEFVSIDASLALHSLKDCCSVSLPGRFTKLVGRLGGKNADLASHVGVAFSIIGKAWREASLPWIARQAIVGSLLENLCKERPLSQAMLILRTFVDFGKTDLKSNSEFLGYLNAWIDGHFLLATVR